jgi:hypothetical protein
MRGPDPTGQDWSDREIDLIVADYFDMLGMELARQPYVKAQRNAALQELTGRSRGSIEFKHQNISAVLLKLGMPWIQGYKPMANFQRALIDGIERFIEASGETLVVSPVAETRLADNDAIFFEAPPSLSKTGPAEPVVLRRLVRKFDPAARDARNRTLGRQGEERVLFSERSRLADAGRDDLARKVRWVSEEDGDGVGYDILSFCPAGDERLLEVKTTSGHRTTPFYLTENERALSAERPEEFRLVRLYDFLRVPKAFQLKPPLEESVMLRPTNYRASFDA